MSDTASKMPPRIWATDAREGLQMWSDEKWPIYSNTEYRRADIVERLAEALNDLVSLIKDVAPEYYESPMVSDARIFLNSYREASNEKA